MRVIRKLAAENFKPKIIFDVGANTGHTSVLFRKTFPEARLYCFEPVSSTFSVLQHRVGQDPLTQVHRAALGRSNGTAMMRAVPNGLANRLVRHKKDSIPTESVPVHAGDLFCSEHDISQIDFLKIDAEGSDLDVLVGFQGMMSKKRIDYIQVECGISHQNKQHIPFESFKTFMSVMGYGLIGLFDGTVGRGKRGLYYCNAVFVAEGTAHFNPARRVAPVQQAEVNSTDAA